MAAKSWRTDNKRTIVDLGIAVDSVASRLVVAKASEQFRQSDVTIWGIVALVFGGLAVLGANISAVVPQGLLASLHQPRVAGPSVETLRQELADLKRDSARLQRENVALNTRFSMQERSGNDVIRRVAALEVSVPKLLEGLPDSVLVDRANLTASVGENDAQTFDADGGSVTVRQVPMPGLGTVVAPDQPLPEPVVPQTALVATAPAAYGIAIGAPVGDEQLVALWGDLNLKLGPLLLGLAPVVSEDSTGTLKRIVVGPFTELSEARALCERFERVSIACTPGSYSGTPL
jgi:hypothetical protein